jgi:spore coat protein CotH
MTKEFIYTLSLAACIPALWGCQSDILDATELRPGSSYPPDTNAPADPAGGTDEPNPDISNVPTAFHKDKVVEVRFEMANQDWSDILANPQAEVYVPGNIIYDGMRSDNVAIRVKGNSSLSSVARSGGDRYSFKVDINRYSEDQELLGKKKFNFNNGYHDPSMMREHLAYEVMEEFGLTASKTGFVDLWLNDEHMGLYTVVEHVDGSYLNDRFDDPDGDLYKPAGTGADLNWRGEGIQNYPGLQIERNEETTDHSAAIELIRTLSEQPGARPLQEVLDVDRALRYLATVVTMSIYDSYLGSAHNYYLYEESGRFTVIPWDLNGAFAIHTCGCNRQGLIDFRIDEPTCGPINERPLVKHLLSDPDRLATYHSYIEELLDGLLSSERMESRIDEVADMIRPYVDADERKFYTLEEFEQNLESDVIEPPERVLMGLETFLQERSASIRAQLDGTQASTNNGAGNCMRSGGGGGGGTQDRCGDGVCSRRERRDNSCPADCQ